MVEVLYGEHRFPQLPKVQLENPSHGVDVRGVRHIRQRILAPLEGVAEVIDLNLGAGDAEDPVVVEAVQVDYPNTASND